jgi:hypothetical protein
MNSLQVIRSKNIWAQHAQEQVDLAAKNYNSRSLRVEKFLPAEYYSIMLSPPLQQSRALGEIGFETALAAVTIKFPY